MGELSCHIVRDLLPLYQEGLLSEESKCEVEAHLANCEDCREIYCKMRTALEVNEEAEYKKDIDYLRKVKQHNYGKILLAVCAVLAVVAGIWATNAFYVGQDAEPADVFWQCFQDGEKVYVNVMAVDSAVGFRNWDIAPMNAENQGYYDITAKKVLISSLSTGDWEFSFDIDEVQKITLFGEVIWQEGIGIIPKVAELYDAHTPYVGDLSAIGRVARALNIADRCGNFKNELHTSAEPYSWSFDFTDELDEKWQSDELDYQMERNAYFLIALIDNLSVVKWTYTDSDGNFQEKSISIHELENNLPALYESYNQKMQTAFQSEKSLKAYADSLPNLQILYNVLYNILL